MRVLRSLRTQLAVGVGVLVLVIVGLAGVALVAQMDARDRAAVDAQLTARLARIGEDVGKVVDGGGSASTDPYGDVLLADSDSLVRVIQNGTVVAQRGAIPTESVPVPSEDGFATLTVDGAPWRSLTSGTHADSGIQLQVMQSLTAEEARLAGNAWLVAVVTLAATLLAVLGGWTVARLVLRPLGALSHGAGRIRDEQRTGFRLPAVSSPREVAELSTTLNGMLEQLDSSMTATRRFTADAGHELRTPLTSLTALLETLQRNPGLDAADRETLLARARDELARVTALLAGLQSLARGDAGALPQAERIDLADVVAGAVSDAGRRHPSVVFSFEGPPADAAADVMGWREGLRLAIDNLLDNAALHGGTSARVAVTAAASEIVVRVTDDGPGIPLEERDRLRGRFARGAAARSPGSGLGLALVEQQAALHGGRLLLETADGGGLAASIVLPVVRVS